LRVKRLGDRELLTAGETADHQRPVAFYFLDEYAFGQVSYGGLTLKG
jgi:hypothetical protein